MVHACEFMTFNVRPEFLEVGRSHEEALAAQAESHQEALENERVHHEEKLRRKSLNQVPSTPLNVS